MSCPQNSRPRQSRTIRVMIFTNNISTTLPKWCRDILYAAFETTACVYPAEYSVCRNRYCQKAHSIGLRDKTRRLWPRHLPAYWQSPSNRHPFSNSQFRETRSRFLQGPSLAALRPVRNERHESAPVRLRNSGFAHRFHRAVRLRRLPAKKGIDTLSSCYRRYQQTGPEARTDEAA